MEKLKIKFNNVLKALGSLEQVVSDYKKSINKTIFSNLDQKTLNEYLRDSLIQQNEETVKKISENIPKYFDLMKMFMKIVSSYVD